MPATTQAKDPARVRADAFLDAHAIGLLRLCAVDVLDREHVVDAPRAGFATALAGRLEVEPGSVAGALEQTVQLQPDLTTIAHLPSLWADAVPAAALVAELGATSGVVPCPRRALRRELHQLAAHELQLKIGPRIELYLLERAADGEWQPLGEVDASSRADLRIEAFQAELAAMLEAAGIALISIQRAAGPAQIACELAPLDALAAADALVRLRRLARRLARARGFVATFLPRPIAGAAGSSLRLRFDLRDAEDASALQANLPAARGFLAGILEHAAALCALTNPLINSYKRLLPGRPASLVAWSSDGALPMLRLREQSELPAELRSPDPCCQPYLAFAGLLAAGRDGIARGLELPEPIPAAPAELPRRERARIATLPSTLHDAIVAFERDELLGPALGEPLVQPWLSQAKLAWAEFADEVHAWELQRYLPAL